MLRAICGERVCGLKDPSTRVPKGVSGTVVGVKVSIREGGKKDARAKEIKEMQPSRAGKD